MTATPPSEAPRSLSGSKRKDIDSVFPQELKMQPNGKKPKRNQRKGMSDIKIICSNTKKEDNNATLSSSFLFHLSESEKHLAELSSSNEYSDPRAHLEYFKDCKVIPEVVKNVCEFFVDVLSHIQMLYPKWNKFESPFYVLEFGLGTSTTFVDITKLVDLFVLVLSMGCIGKHIVRNHTVIKNSNQADEMILEILMRKERFSRNSTKFLDEEEASSIPLPTKKVSFLRNTLNIFSNLCKTTAVVRRDTCEFDSKPFQLDRLLLNIVILAGFDHNDDVPEVTKEIVNGKVTAKYSLDENSGGGGASLVNLCKLKSLIRKSTGNISQYICPRIGLEQGNTIVISLSIEENVIKVFNCSGEET